MPRASRRSLPSPARRGRSLSNRSMAKTVAAVYDRRSSTAPSTVNDPLYATDQWSEWDERSRNRGTATVAASELGNERVSNERERMSQDFRSWALTFDSMYSTLTSLQRKRYLFVCINRRADDNPKGCCALKDSEEVYRALKGEVAARGLAKLEARVCTSSCLDQCATGVTVLVEPDHFFYGHVTVADVPEIVDGIVSDRRVERLVLTADDLEKA